MDQGEAPFLAKEESLLKAVSKLANLFNSLVNYVAVALLGLMVIIVFYQVITRYIFDFSSTTLQVFSLVFLVWFGFLGTAIGFRDRLHIGVDFIYNHFPDLVKKICDVFTQLLVMAVGILFLHDGMKFLQITSISSLPGTNFTSSVLYICIPVTGVIMFFYGASRLVRLFIQQENSSRKV